MNDETSSPRRTSLYGLVAEARGYLEQAPENIAGFLRPRKLAMADIFVSKDALDRALSTASAIFRAFGARGHVVTLARHDTRQQRPPVYPRGHNEFSLPTWGLWSPDRCTVTTIDDVTIGLSLFEKTKSVDVEPVGFSDKKMVLADRRKQRAPWQHIKKGDMPSGVLVFRAYATAERIKWQQEWTAPKNKDAATIVDAIVAAVPAISRQIAEERERMKQNEAKWAEESRRSREQAEVQRRAAAEAESVKELRAVIEAWRTAHAVDAFFTDVERRADDLEVPEREALVQRLERARAMIVGDDAAARLLAWRLPEER